MVDETGLVERLRAETTAHIQFGQSSEDDVISAIPDPLCNEAADAIEALQQEVESIRSAAARVVTLARNGGAAAIDALDTAIENGASNGR